MRHSKAILLLPDLAQGRVTNRQRRALLAHLPRCPECRDLLRTYGDLGSALALSGPAAPHHVDSVELVSFVLEPDALEPADKLRVGAHLEVCSACRADADAVRRTEASLRRESSSGRVGWVARIASCLEAPWIPALASATIVAALAVYPAWIGLVKAPALRQDLDRALSEEQALSSRVAALRSEIEQLRSRPPDVPEGAYAPAMLRPGLRGAGATAVVELSEDDRLAELVVELATEGLTKTGVRHRIEAVRSDGTVAWSEDIEGASLVDLLRTSDGVLYLRISAKKLPPGRYELRHSLVSGEAVEAIPFEVVKKAR